MKIMAISLKPHPFFAGVIGIAITTPSMAESELQLGLVTAVNTTFYQGIDEEYYLLPLLIAEYGRFYLQGVHGGYRLFQNDEGQSLALEVRRTFDGYSKDDMDDRDALAGMSDRDAAWEAGLAYEAPMAGGQVKAKLMQDVSDTHNGLSARFEYERPLWTDQTHMLSWYAGSEYWNSNKTDYYFGVTPGEATADHSAYSADDSSSFFVGSNIVKQIDKNITILANIEYLRMNDAVSDSPLVDRQDQWSAYAGIFYKF
jgi:outer membrane protein